MKKLLTLIPAAALLVGCSQVSGDETGLVLNRRSPSECVSSGWHSTVSIGKEIYHYSTGAQRTDMLRSKDEGDSPKDESIQTFTLEGSTINWDLTVNYTVSRDCDKIKHLYINRYRTPEDIRDRLIKATVRSTLRDVVAPIPTIEALTTKRETISATLVKTLNEKLNKAPAKGAVSIESVELRGTYIDDATQRRFNDAVEAKAVAAKTAIERETKETQAETERLLASKQNETDLAKARSTAEQAKIQFETEAARKLAAAKAQAEANRLEAESLTPEIIAMRIKIAEAEALGKAGAVIVGGGNGGSAPSIVLDSRQ